MGAPRRYRSFVADSARWDGFRFRADDIVISTPPKAGTTWTQMICALLIFQHPVLDQPLTELSPWLDMLTADLDAVLEQLESQRHRRFIKTHTPLDGLVTDPNVTYVCVGRDPRDIAISWDHHMANIDFERLLALREATVGPDDPDAAGPGLEPPPEDPVERFWQWVEDDHEPSDGVVCLASVLHHYRTFWERRDDPHLGLFHYTDLRADLEGEMRRLAALLAVDVPRARWPELVDAATFARMRARADELAPEVTKSLWRDHRRFFHSGSNGQWRSVMTDDDLARYDARVREVLDDEELAAWAHGGRRALERR